MSFLTEYPKKMDILLEMENILDEIETPYVDCQTLLAHLRGYKKPRDRIARMVKKGELLRLKNGFFLIASRFRRGKKEYPYEQVANLLYGPSYVSLEWALAFYGLIPERVSVVTSVTTGSSKSFATPIGTFSYRHLSHARYSVGIDHKTIEGQVGGFLLATPEKALADWIFLTCKGMDRRDLLRELVEAKRVELEALRSLDRENMEVIARAYASKEVKELAHLIEEL